MKPDIYWVAGLGDFRLGLTARPRSGDWLEDEISAWRRAGVDVVVSLLEPVEVRELMLGEEASLCTGPHMRFLSFPIPDRGTPASLRATVNLVDSLVADLKGGTAILIHCRAGIGRTGLIAACLLVRLGVPMSDIFPALSAARGVSMPDTSEQSAWVKCLGG